MQQEQEQHDPAVIDAIVRLSKAVGDLRGDAAVLALCSMLGSLCGAFFGGTVPEHVIEILRDIAQQAGAQAQGEAPVVDLPAFDLDE